MVSGSDSNSSDGGHQKKSRKRKRNVSPNPNLIRYTNKNKNNERNKSTKGSREYNNQRENNDLNWSSDKYRRSNKDNREKYDKKRYVRSLPRKDDNRSRQREYEDRHRKYGGNDHDRKYTREKKSSFSNARMKNETAPEWGKPNVKNESISETQEKEKPNFEISGKLTEDTNTVNGVVIKYSEPVEARKPKRRWRLYTFKGEKELPTLYIHRQSAYLMGRDRKIADIPLDHPSCSKQHAALQYRVVSYNKDGGGQSRRIRPYLIDLDSANGTFVNNVRLEARKYHELLEKDVIRFGFSTRDYVLLHEHSKDESLDDDLPLTATT